MVFESASTHGAAPCDDVRVNTVPEFLGLATACLAIVMLIARYLPWLKEKKDFISVIEVSTAVAAFVAVVWALFESGIAELLIALGWGFGISLAIVAVVGLYWWISRTVMRRRAVRKTRPKSSTTVV